MTDTMTGAELIAALQTAFSMGLDPNKPLFINNGEDILTIDGITGPHGQSLYWFLDASDHSSQPDSPEEAINDATAIIAEAEADLGALTAGQRRDLLKDNTDWESSFCDMVADLIPGAHVHSWVEAVDDDGMLIEPAYDVCASCGATRD